MRKTTVALALLAVAIMITISASFNVKTAHAENDVYTIEQVTHSVKVTYNGCLFINDTITMNGTGPTSPNSFFIGLPRPLNSFLLKFMAYDSLGSFQTHLDIPLENQVGFYGAQVDFAGRIPQVFSVGFVLSNDLLVQDSNNASIFKLSFPAYPVLNETAALCNVSVELPNNAQLINGTALTYWSNDLPAFTYNVTDVSFLMTGDDLQLFDITRIDRELKVDESGAVFGSDAYYILDKATNALFTIRVILPLGTTSPSATDQLGEPMGMSELPNEGSSIRLITLAVQIYPGQTTRFSVNYRLPDSCLVRENTGDFAIDLSLFQNEVTYINEVSIRFVLPEGARVKLLEGSLAGDTHDIARDAFQETAMVKRQGITAMDNLTIRLTYEYNPLWSSFRPTMWAWSIAIVGCAIVVAWQRPKGPARASMPTAAMKLSPEHLKSFVDAYEEKRKITSEIESLETKVQKGRLPRRRYKVLRKTLETRLSVLSRNLTEFRQKTRAAGGKYSDLMRQLEIAETDINEAEVNVKSIDTRHTRGDLSLEAHRKLKADYLRRKENAETTISGILLRLREETL